MQRVLSQKSEYSLFYGNTKTGFCKLFSRQNSTYTRFPHLFLYKNATFRKSSRIFRKQSKKHLDKFPFIWYDKKAAWIQEPFKETSFRSPETASF